MTNTINSVPRELLERVLNAGWGSETVNALDDLRDFLASAPSPADHVEDVRAMVVPSIEASYAIGAKGGSVVDAERLAFESWMAGHCWGLCAAWDGSGYRCESEQAGQFSPAAGMTRRLWAAWRDRAALAALAAVCAAAPKPVYFGIDLASGPDVTIYDCGRCPTSAGCLGCCMKAAAPGGE